MADRMGVAFRSATRALTVAILSPILALGVTIALAGPATAAPDQPADAALVAQAEALRAKLDAKQAAAERLTERLNATEERRRQLQASLGAVQASHQAVQAELASAQLELDAQARAMYMQGPPELVGLLQGGDPLQVRSEPELRQADVETQAAVVADIRRREAELAASLEQAGAELAAATVVHDRDTAARRKMQTEANRLQATLDGIDRRLGGFLRAEEARAETARRAGYAGYTATLGRAVSGMRAGPAARAAVKWALAQLGDPYRWAASGPDAFDCSGLTSAAYRAAGTGIPRTSLGQWAAGPHPGVAALLPGDLVFYGDSAGSPGTIHHVGLYIGKGLMVHAPRTGDVVRVASIWRDGYVGAVRVVPAVRAPGVTAPSQPPPSTTAPPPPTITTRPSTTTTQPSTTTTRPSTTTSTTAPPTTTTAGSTTTGATTTTTGATTTTTGATTTTTGATTTTTTTTTTVPPPP